MNSKSIWDKRQRQFQEGEFLQIKSQFNFHFEHFQLQLCQLFKDKSNNDIRHVIALAITVTHCRENNGMRGINIKLKKLVTSTS